MVTLANLQGSSLVPDIGAQLGRGVRIGGEIQRQQILGQQAEAAQVAAQQQQAQEARRRELLGLPPLGVQLGATPGFVPDQPVPQLGVQAQQPTQQLGVQPAQAQQQAPTNLDQLAIEFPEEAQKIANARKAQFENTSAREKQKIESIVVGAAQALASPNPLAFLKNRALGLEDPTETNEAIAAFEAGDVEGGTAMLQDMVSLGQQLDILKPPAGGAADLTAGQREFAGLTEGLTEGQKNEARLIKLGLSPRAVGSAIQTISEAGIASQIGDAEATIKERAKFGELTGSSRAKAIDSGFDSIRKIDKNISNLDKAIAAVEAGAGTGAIERRFPSIRAASVALDQIQGELALDVIGSVTFGALSEGELNLAKQIALPTGLEGPELIQHLRDRQAAQSKLRSYFNEQIDFLDQGGSVAGFLRNKERQTETGQQPTAGQPLQVGRFTVEAE